MSHRHKDVSGIGSTKEVLSAALIVLCAAVWTAPTAAEPPVVPENWIWGSYSPAGS